MTTAIAQDRLLEATAVIARNRHEFNVLMRGVVFAASVATGSHRTEAGRFWVALGDLINAVAEEQIATQDESAFTEGN